MFKCDRCGEVLEFLPTVKETRPFGSTVCYEEVASNKCRCGGTFEKTQHKCQKCGEWSIEPGFDYEMCPECQDDSLNDILRILKSNFTPEQINCFLENEDAVWEAIK